ncbi:MAG: NAD(+)/NADH kinase [Oscillospiraceae bacterium]|nr:NAD(+)/NADH kinase [Oscillospiraceae bacterium]
MSKKIVLCPNPQRDGGWIVTRRVYDMLKAVGEEVVISPLFDKYGGSASISFAPVLPLEEALKDAKMVIPFGGDGTILSAARAATHYGTPILGVNLGHRGYIAEIEADRLESILLAISDNYSVEERMMLDVKVVRNGETVFSDLALNDAVIGGIARQIDVVVYADEHKTLGFSGDGVIVSTPTGSTAYSMAAGGPIVEPSAKNMIITPISPHALFARALVLSPGREVRIETGRLSDRRAYMTSDGTEPVPLKDGDIVKISTSECVTRLVQLNDISFYEKVYRKLGENQ